MDAGGETKRLQKGIKHYTVSFHFKDAGIAIAQPRCLRVQHRRLLAGTS